jgi:hypothetical protein
VTTAPVPTPLALGDLLSRSWVLFKRNWIVALPPFIAGFGAMIVLMVLVVAGVMAAIAHGTPEHWSGGFIASLIGGYVLFLAFAIFAAIWATVAMFGMADAVWARGSTTLADGMAAFGARGGAAIAATVGFCGLLVVALVLMLPTLGLSVLALPFATMYMYPAVVTGRVGGFESIRESFQLVRRFFGASVVVYLVLYAIQYGISLVMIVAIVPLEFSTIPLGSDTQVRMPPIPLLGFSGAVYAATLLALIAYNGFHSLALVGMYRDLMSLPSHQALPSGAPLTAS